MLPKVFTCTAYTLHRSNSFSYHLIRAHMWNLTQIGTSDEGLRLAGEQNSADNSNCGRCSEDRSTIDSGTEIKSSSRDTVEWRLLPPVMGASGGGLRTSETGGEGRILRLTSSSDFSFVLIFICTGWVDGGVQGDKGGWWVWGPRHSEVNEQWHYSSATCIGSDPDFVEITQFPEIRRCARTWMSLDEAEPNSLDRLWQSIWHERIFWEYFVAFWTPDQTLTSFREQNVEKGELFISYNLYASWVQNTVFGPFLLLTIFSNNDICQFKV